MKTAQSGFTGYIKDEYTTLGGKFKIGKLSFM